MKKDLSDAIAHHKSMRRADVVTAKQMADLFGINQNGFMSAVKNSKFTKPDIVAGEILLWSKAALGAEIERRQAKINKPEMARFSAWIPKEYADFANEKGGAWLAEVLKRELKKEVKAIKTLD